ncbi:hypothetical protein Lal_00049633 [Lupinus albus]|nr:hypothetical protein Lal_00049633 [Lupinus albus]
MERTEEGIGSGHKWQYLFPPHCKALINKGGKGNFECYIGCHFKERVEEALCETGIRVIAKQGQSLSCNMEHDSESRRGWRRVSGTANYHKIPNIEFAKQKDLIGSFRNNIKTFCNPTQVVRSTVSSSLDNTSPAQLKLIMHALRESKCVQLKAFHVFKLLVAS